MTHTVVSSATREVVIGDDRPVVIIGERINPTCGASNVSFGLPNREGINGAFLAMAIASGLTSAITNPIAEGVRTAVMAADVLQGNDQDAARWIRTHRAGPPDGDVGGRRVNRRRAGGEPPQRIAGTEAVATAGD
jgi:5-methyltetrahydrofolate--homocysteine methyltransferase